MWQKDFLSRYDGGMRNRLLLVTLSALVLSGCPAGGFFGRYLVVNNTGSTVTNLTISVGTGNDQIWDETLPGQGWIHSTPIPGGPKFLIVSWNDETGYHNERFSFENKTTYQSKADVYVELNPRGGFAWRIIEPPTENGGPATILAAVLIYLFYCLGVGLVIGLPLALAALIAYGLLIVMRTGAIATVQGLHGDRSVFQFTIREILLLTTAIALALGWFFHVWHA
jgi:hypothetical protein